MDALLVVDMQEGMLQGGAKHGLPAVIERINRIAARVRTEGGAELGVDVTDTPPPSAQRGPRKQCASWCANWSQQAQTERNQKYRKSLVFLTQANTPHRDATSGTNS